MLTLRTGAVLRPRVLDAKPYKRSDHSADGPDPRRSTEGFDTPKEGTALIKEKFGLDVSKPQLSTYKSIAKKKAQRGQSGGGSRKAARRSGRRTAAAANATINNGMGHNGGIDTLNAVAVKELCRRCGADKVRTIVALFE